MILVGIMELSSTKLLLPSTFCAVLLLALGFSSTVGFSSSLDTIASLFVRDVHEPPLAGLFLSSPSLGFSSSTPRVPSAFAALSS